MLLDPTPAKTTKGDDQPLLADTAGREISPLVAEKLGPIILLGMGVVVFVVAIALIFAGHVAAATSLIATAMVGVALAAILDRLEIIDLFGLLEAKLHPKNRGISDGYSNDERDRA